MATNFNTTPALERSARQRSWEKHPGYQDIPGRIGASWRRPPSRHHQTRQKSAACWHRQQSGWHQQRRPSRQPALLPCSVGPRSQTACAADRNRGKCLSWRKSSGPAPRHRGRAGRTSGRRVWCTSSHNLRSERIPKHWPTSSIRTSSSGSVEGRPVEL